MNPWEDVRTLRAQARALEDVLKERIIEAAGPAGVRIEGTALTHWVDVGVVGDIHLRNSRQEWSNVEKQELGKFVRSLGFRSLEVFDYLGRCVFCYGP